MIKITYYDTLYKRFRTDIVANDIIFAGNSVVFASFGHKYRIELKYVRKIEPLNRAE